MPTENERKDVQKAMAYDLLRILKQDPDKTYTAAELEKLIDAYITGSQQSSPRGRGTGPNLLKGADTH